MNRYSIATVAALAIAAASPAFAQQTDSARFEPEIQAFEHEDSLTPPPQHPVLFVGSSSIRMWCTLERDFPSLEVLNRGFGGSESSDAIHYADRVIVRYHPRAIVLYEGDNDLAAGKTPARVAADLDSLVGLIHQRVPEAPVYFLAIKPSPSRARLLPAMRATNALVRRAAARDTLLTYVDVFTPMLDRAGRPRVALFGADSLHMNSAGYALWRSTLLPYLTASSKRPR